MTDTLRLRVGGLYRSRINHIRVFDKRGRLIKIEVGGLAMYLAPHPQIFNHHLFLLEDEVVGWHFPEKYNAGNWWDEVV